MVKLKYLALLRLASLNPFIWVQRLVLPRGMIDYCEKTLHMNGSQLQMCVLGVFCTGVYGAYNWEQKYFLMTCRIYKNIDNIHETS